MATTLKLIRKKDEITALNGAVIDGLDSNSTKDAPSIHAVKQVMSKPNLLINGDFRNPVNQRGATSYSSTANNMTRIFGIDRWNMQNGTSMTVNSNSITLTGNSASSGVCMFSQVVEHTFVSTYTVQVKVLSMSNGSELVIQNTSGTVYRKNLTTGINTFTVTDTDILIIQINLGSSSTLELEWIKLEEGSEPTLYAARPYAEELLLCQRYFDIVCGVRVPAVEQRNDHKSYTYCIPKAIRNMRVAPTLSVTGNTTTNSINGICVRTVSTATLTGFTFEYGTSEYGLLITATSSDALTKQSYETQLYINGSFKIYLDAEIY